MILKFMDCLDHFNSEKLVKSSKLILLVSMREYNLTVFVYVVVQFQF